MVKYILPLLISISLFAQVPMPPDSVTIEYFHEGDSLRISWQPVTHDTAGNPICISMYRIFCNYIPVFPDDAIPCGMTLDQYHSIIMDITPAQLAYSPRWFYWVTAREGG